MLPANHSGMEVVGIKEGTMSRNTIRVTYVLLDGRCGPLMLTPIEESRSLFFNYYYLTSSVNPISDILLQLFIIITMIIIIIIIIISHQL